MQSRAEFLKSLGEEFDRFEPLQVAKRGCGTGIAAALLVIAAGAAGWIPAHPVFPRFLRLLVLSVLGCVFLVFAVFAILETRAERRAEQALDAFVRSGGGDVSSLLEMARARRGRFAGSERVIEILEGAAGSQAPPA